MTLTSEQRTAVIQGEAVTVAEPELGECVVVRKDVFEQMKTMMYDDSEFSAREAYPFVDRVMADDDANDPVLESYQRYERP